MSNAVERAAPVREFENLRSLLSLVGQELACSDWMTIDQARIDQFAQATGDHQWIHVDPVRSAKGPYGGTIAHGLLTLSLIGMLMAQAMTIHNVRMGVNYGSNKVRYPAPVPADSRIRACFVLSVMTPLPPLDGVGGFELVFDVMAGREASTKPACVAQFVSRRYG